MNTCHPKPNSSIFVILLMVFSTLITSGISAYAQCPGSNIGYVNPSIAVNNTSTGAEVWNNPGNALTDNNSYATMSNPALLIGGTVRQSNFLVVRNFNINIPVNAQICGVQAEIRKLCSDNSGSNYTRDLDIRLLKGNQILGTNHANIGVNWPTTEAAFTYGTNADLWGTTLTGFDVSNNGFGLAIGIESRAAGLLLPTVISYIDAVRIRVYYTVPSNDMDGDGIVDVSDNDIDGDGKPNAGELMSCVSSAVILSATTNPTLVFPSTVGISMSTQQNATAGAGVTSYSISENFAAITGNEIYIEQDVITASDQSEQVLKFSSAVHNLSFKLQDIDLIAGTAQDQVTVNAYSSGKLYQLQASDITIGSGNFNQFAGANSFVGLLNMDYPELNGTINIHIPVLVDSVRFIFKNLDITNLGLQGFAIGNISYCNPYAAAQDFDGDGSPDFADMDSDNDGILDRKEYQPSIGFVAPSGTDANTNGLDDAYEVAQGGIAVGSVDTDLDGTPDFHDSDSDNDGTSDQVEGNDANHDCVADFALSNTDTNGNGLDDSYDPNNGGTQASVQDTDNNGTPDFRQNTVPSVSVAGNAASGCNASYTLSANTPSSGLGYWKVVAGTGTFSNVNSPTSTVSGLSAGTNTFAWTIYTDGCHSSTSQKNIVHSTSIPATPSISSNSPVCSGTSITLTTPTVSGATYAWTGPNSFSSSVQNPTISNATTANAGAYSVVVTVGSCSSLPGTATVVINSTPSAPSISSNTPVCEGSSINLSAGLVSGAIYTWSGPNAFSSSVQNPTITNTNTSHSGTYQLTVTVSGCTSAPSTINAVVNAIPNTPIISSNSPVCSGNSINIAANSVAGATYAWTGPNAFLSSVQNPTISNANIANAGGYALAITVNGCTSALANSNVVVNQTPSTPSVSSNAPVCSGNTLSISALTVAGATYTWTGPNAFSSSVQNPTIANSNTSHSGSYQLTVTVSGCTSAPSTINAVVNQTPSIPTISTNSPVCSGNSVNLAANSVAGATYAWTGPNAFLSAVQNPTITNVTSANDGAYTLVVTVNGCTSTSANSTVIVKPTPATPSVSTNSPVCTGNTLNLSTSAVAGATYSWTGPNSFTSSVQNPFITNVTAANAGTYQVAVTVNSCTSLQGNSSVTINTVPSTPVINTNAPICVGDNLTLATSNVAGTTYAWTGPNSFTSSLQNPTISNASTTYSGTYNLTVTVNGCTSPAASAAVVVNTIPNAPTITTNSPICDGSSMTFAPDLLPGTAYFWTGPNGFTSASVNPSITNATLINGGTYTVTVTQNGCTSSPATTNFVVNPIPATPTISNNTPLCEGSDLDLTTPTITGATYTWTGPSSFTSALQNPTITNASTADAGTYNLTVTVNGCTSASGSANVVIHPIPALPNILTNSPICENENIHLLTGNVSGASYAWTGPNGFASTLQNPTINNAMLLDAGTYHLTVTVNNCLSATASTIVVINTRPTMPVVSNNSAICEGATLELSTPFISGVTYAWTGPDGFTSSIQNPTISNTTVANAGVYELVITENGCSSLPVNTTAVITALPTTPVITTNTPLCEGETLTLSSDASSGADFSWTGPVGFSSTLENPSILNTTLSHAGVYELTVTENGCTSATATASVTIHAIPASPIISSNSPLCEGSTLNLISNTISGASYAWTGPNGFTSTQQNPSINSVTPNANGTYSVTVTANGCSSAVAIIAVVVNTNPNVTLAALSTVCLQSDGFTLVGGSPVGGNYSGNGIALGQFNPLTAGIGTHNVTYTFQDNNGCQSSATEAITVNNCAGIYEVKGMEITVAPNPTENMLIISIHGADASYYMMDSEGKTIMNHQTIMNEDAKTIDVSSLARGIYFMVFTSEKGNVVKKVILQ